MFYAECVLALNNHDSNINNNMIKQEYYKVGIV